MTGQSIGARVRQGRRAAAGFAASCALALLACGSVPKSSAPVVACECPPTPPAPLLPITWANNLRPVNFSQLPGWERDRLTEAWSAFRRSCSALASQPDWVDACTQAAKVDSVSDSAIRVFFESHFAPHAVVNPDGTREGLITGYYEPLLRGSRTPSSSYPYPVYGVPEDLVVVDLAAVYPEVKDLRLRGRLEGNRVLPYWSRTEIETGRAPLAGQALIWVDDMVDLFFLQIQGSGRVALDDGEIVRLSYAEQNGYPYRSIGRLLVERGELPVDQASMRGIRGWGERNPEKWAALLQENASYVFFRIGSATEDAPSGTLGVPLTPKRSIAVDPRAIPLGAPVYLSTTSPASTAPLERLTMAQDTGGAIKGAVRADLFWGSGEEAGASAGRMRQSGRMWVLLPREFPRERQN